MSIILGYDWPGNVRELRNVLERALIMAPDADVLLPAHLPPEIFTRGAADGEDSDAALPLEEVEKRHILRVLAHQQDNRSRAARALGISRATLYEKLHKYGLS